MLFACLGGGFATCSCVHGEPSSFTVTNHSPAPPILHQLGENELVTLLTETLQREYIKTRGELELHLTRPWITRPVPDAPLTVKIVELPNAGVTASCIVRFELLNGETKLGDWQLPVQAKVWREVWVAHAAVKRGDSLAEADLARERRDVLNVRDAFADFTDRDAAYELADSLQVGGILLARSIRLKAVIHRGQVAEARLEQGALRITMKVEALEDGAPGQTIRARNPQTHRDLRGRVVDEQTIALSL